MQMFRTVSDTYEVTLERICSYTSSPGMEIPCDQFLVPANQPPIKHDSESGIGAYEREICELRIRTIDPSCYDTHARI